MVGMRVERGVASLAFSSALLSIAAWQLLRIIGRITLAQATVTSVGDTFA